ncbi:hypothetical protein Drorol1_Dr00000498 [Drosera rotundifolia]
MSIRKVKERKMEKVKRVVEKMRKGSEKFLALVHRVLLSWTPRAPHRPRRPICPTQCSDCKWKIEKGFMNQAPPSSFISVIAMGCCPSIAGITKGRPPPTWMSPSARRDREPAGIAG